MLDLIILQSNCEPELCYLRFLLLFYRARRRPKAVQPTKNRNKRPQPRIIPLMKKAETPKRFCRY